MRIVHKMYHPMRFWKKIWRVAGTAFYASWVPFPEDFFLMVQIFLVFFLVESFGFWLNYVVILGYLAENCRIGLQILAEFSKMHFQVSRKTVRKKILFEELMVFFYHCRVWAKIFGFWQNFLGSVLFKSAFCASWMFWVNKYLFEEIHFKTYYSNLSRKKSDFWEQFSHRVVETALNRPRATSG